MTIDKSAKRMNHLYFIVLSVCQVQFSENETRGRFVSGVAVRINEDGFS